MASEIPKAQPPINYPKSRPTCFTLCFNARNRLTATHFSDAQETERIYRDHGEESSAVERNALDSFIKVIALRSI